MVDHSSRLGDHGRYLAYRNLRLNEPTSAGNRLNSAQYRIGISDLLVWTTCAALVIAFNRWMFYANDPPQDWLEKNEFRFQVLFGYQAIFIGVQLASVFVLAKSIIRKYDFPNAPGHYLLLLAGLTFLATVFQYAVVKFMQPGVEIESNNWFMFFYTGSFSHLLASSLAFVGAFATRRHWHWMLYFLFYAIEMALVLLFAFRPFLSTKWPEQFDAFAKSLDFVPAFMFYAIWILFCWTFACIIIDMFARRRWSLLHWIGIISIWAITFGNMAFNYFKWFAR